MPVIHPLDVSTLGGLRLRAGAKARSSRNQMARVWVINDPPAPFPQRRAGRVGTLLAPH
jgi:hypothetical protein